MYASNYRGTKMPDNRKDIRITSYIDNPTSSNTTDRFNHAFTESDYFSNVRRLVISTTGRAFPPESRIRGRLRGGGMALGVVGWTADDWRSVAGQIWKGLNGRIRIGRGGSWLLMGYPYTRPSRPRCSLYVCREALRVAKAWVEEYSMNNSGGGRSKMIDEIVIVSDCNYVVDTLENTTRLLEWGSNYETVREMVEAHKGCKANSITNIDILHPLSRTFKLLISSLEEARVQENSGNDGERLRISAKKVVKFRRATDFEQHVDVNRLAEGAKVAAQLMYDQVK